MTSEHFDINHPMMLISVTLYANICPMFSLSSIRYAVIAFGCASCPKITCGREGCGTEFCYHCKQLWHPNQTCDAARQQRAQSLRLRTVRSSSLSYSQESGAAGWWTAPFSFLYFSFHLTHHEHYVKDDCTAHSLMLYNLQKKCLDVFCMKDSQFILMFVLP